MQFSAENIFWTKCIIRRTDPKNVEVDSTCQKNENI